MKQIFEWLREQMEEAKYLIVPKGKSSTYDDAETVVDIADAERIIDEAEAKWEAECCELLDELVLETPQYRHGVCAFRHEEECGEYESCEHCLVSAIKDLLVNPNSRFKKISEVE